MQFISDLHLDLLSKTSYQEIVSNILSSKGNNNYIALLGDIGTPVGKKNNFYSLLLERLSQEYKEVFLISGNHEYYCPSKSIREIDDIITQLCDQWSNVHYLNNKTYYIPDNDVTIIGTTLWSYIPPSYEKEVTNAINDYKSIKDFTPEVCNNLYKNNTDFIIDELNKLSPSTRAIILTHHAPLKKGVSFPFYELHNTNCAFSSDLSCLIKPPIIAWCFGHTHWQTEIRYNGVRVCSNPVGYKNELCRYGQTINYIQNVKL
jgi:predicted MPP superfamily phosphohydrolase